MINIELREILEEQGKKYTGIDIELSQGATVITGANMGGKSVALNTITENILLFHMGFYLEKVLLFHYLIMYFLFQLIIRIYQRDLVHLAQKLLN